MNKNRNFLNLSNWFFWLIMATILFMLLPYFKNGFYNEGNLDNWISNFDTISPNPKPTEEDSLQKPKVTTWAIWHWRDYNYTEQKIKFKLPENADVRATANRFNSAGSSLEEVYSSLYEYDRVLLSDLIAKMKQKIKDKGFNYMEAIEYVCSSIQYIPYTLVQPPGGSCPCEQDFGSFSANCKVQNDGLGCCPDVYPNGVYSPLEFVRTRLGDCDTRALLAYTFLKPMGFDVAVMVSIEEGHSVLGIYLPQSSQRGYAYGTNAYGKKYYLWELTSKDWRFGENTVNGSDWNAELE